MDIFIITGAVTAWAVFPVLHAVLMRAGNHEKVFGKLFLSYVISSLILIILFIFWYGTGAFPVQDAPSVVFCGLLSWFFFTSLSLMYIILLFGMAMSSVRMSILSLIYRAGKKGIEDKMILQYINKDTIIGTRLERFSASGEIRLEKGYYYRQKKLSPYSLPDLFVQLIWKLYGGMEDVHTVK